MPAERDLMSPWDGTSIVVLIKIVQSMRRANEQGCTWSIRSLASRKSGPPSSIGVVGSPLADISLGQTCRSGEFEFGASI